MVWVLLWIDIHISLERR